MGRSSSHVLVIYSVNSACGTECSFCVVPFIWLVLNTLTTIGPLMDPAHQNTSLLFDLHKEGGLLGYETVLTG